MPDVYNNTRPEVTSSDEEEVISLPVNGAETPEAEETAPVETEPVETAPVETAPVETAPVETAPVETVPVETVPVETASVEAAPMEAGTLVQWLDEPAAGGISCGGWAGLGLLSGLLLAGGAAGVCALLRRRRRKPDPAAQGPWSGSVSVEKLHEQGARSGQQDCFFVSPPEDHAGVLAVVTDGMGGLADGDKVSQAAVSAMAQAYYHAQGTPQQVLLRLAEQAASAVNLLLGDDGIYQSGSTLTAGLIRDGAFHYLSVGDSRICLYREGVLYQLNREHIFRNELYTRFVNGEETLDSAEKHPKAAGLTSFLGMGPLRHIDLPAEPVTVRPGDRFILMSDGVYNALTRAEMTAALEQGPGKTAQALDEAIRAKAYQNQDNYTAVILNC